MSLVEKVSIVLDGSKQAVVTTPLLEKKYLTKDVDKGTDELEDMKQAVVTIRRNYLDKFEVDSKVSKGWFNLDSEFKNKDKSTIDPEFYKKLKWILKVKTRNFLKRFSCRLIKNSTRQKM